ncbi:MAG TPA: PaaI family thioesterase [Deltaproteobacteria bacterium]|nr:PaaI family thioesterase [Deltaproteobacteria bacterium]
MNNYREYLEGLKKGEKGLNPFLDFLDIKLTDLKDGFAEFRMKVLPEYMQGAKIMQGGLIVALGDEAIAHAMMTQVEPDEGLTTVELKSNFLSAVSEGELIARANVFKKGKSLIIGDCLVTDDKGKNICRVSATFLLLKNK